VPRAPAAAALVVLAAVVLALTLPGKAAAAPLPWCGSGEPSADLPDAVSAFEWHAIYAIPADGADRFGYFAPRITSDIAAMSNWWLGQDSTRKPRFDLLQVAGCPSEYQSVDISVVHLAHANSGESYQQIVADLEAAGFNSPDKGYLIYYDGSLHVGQEYGVCGQGGTADVSWAYSIVYLQTCGMETDDGTRAAVATHELTHGLGAVPDEAPHACNDGHVCDSPNDLMKAELEDGDSLANLQLDVGRDDYYGHSGAWWDTRDSDLLYDLDVNLPAAPAIVATATSSGQNVEVDWNPSPANDGVDLRVYGDDGTFEQQIQHSSFADHGAIGETLTWVLRSVDNGGYLGPPTTLHFKVGYGIVDATGKVTKDTVPPGAVRNVRAGRSGKRVIVSWTKVPDLIGLRGYRVSVPGLAPAVVKTTAASIPLASARGKTVTVAAVDEAGNRGAAGTVHVAR
jgi:hypothetical protein